MSETPQFLDIQGNLVQLRSMPRPLRILAGLGIAEVLTGVLTLLFKGADFPSAVVGWQNGAELSIGIPFLLLATAILIVAWTYVLTGALQARWWASFPILALTTVVVWGTATASEGRPVSPLALIGLWIYFLLRKTLLRRVRLRIDLLIVGLLVGAMDLAAFVVALTLGGQLWQFPLNISFQVVGLIGLLVPMLVLAGIDVTEVALESSAWVTDRLAILIPPRGYAVALIVLAVAKTVLRVADGSGLSGGLFIALGIILGLALLSYLWRNGSGNHHEPPFWLLLLLASTLFVAPLIVLVAGQLLPMSLLQSVAGTDLQLSWSLAGATVTALALGMIVLARSRHRPAHPSLLFVLIFGFWILVAMGVPGALAPGQATGSPVRVSVTMGELDMATSVSVAIAAAVLLARRRLERRALGFLTAGLLALSLLSGVDSLYEQQFSFGDLLMLLQAALFLVVPAIHSLRSVRRQGASGIVNLASAMLLSAIALFGLVAVLLLAGAALHLLPSGFAFPPDSASILILALAMLWDFLMSGARFTNHDGRHFPRAARLLLYMGYLSLTVAVLLWTSALQGTSGEFFDGNLLPRYGLVVLGMPVVFYLWASSSSRLWSPAEEHA